MKRIKCPIVLLSVFLSLSINLKILIDSTLNWFVKEFKFNFVFFIKVLSLSIVLYLVLYLLFYLIDKIPLSNKKLILTKKRILLIFLCLFISSMLYLLSHYPAVYLNDTIFMLYTPFSRGSPVLYGMLMSKLFFSLNAFFSQSSTMYLMSFIQVIISCAVLTYVIVFFNKIINNKILTITLICYYVFVPIVSNYNVALNKDSPFSILFLLFFILFYKTIDTKGDVLSSKRFILGLILISCLLIFVRSNGLFIVLLSLIFIFILYGFKNHKISCFLIIATIFVSSFIPSAILKLKNLEYPKREIYSVPLQQVCFVVRYFPESIDKNDYQLLSKFMDHPKNTIDKKYNVFTVDNIKFGGNFNDKEFNKNDKKFLKLWIKLLPNNINSYIKSYLLSTYHLWSLNKLESKQSIIYKASITHVDPEKRVYNKVILPKVVHNYLNGFYIIFNRYLNPAGCFVLLLITNVYALIKKKKTVLIISTPLFLLWLSLMLSAPLSSALRYMAPYIYILPIIILYTFNITRGENNNERKRNSKRKLPK